jgi:hypothetical protein
MGESDAMPESDSGVFSGVSSWGVWLFYVWS